MFLAERLRFIQTIEPVSEGWMYNERFGRAVILNTSGNIAPVQGMIDAGVLLAFVAMGNYTQPRNAEESCQTRSISKCLWISDGVYFPGYGVTITRTDCGHHLQQSPGVRPGRGQSHTAGGQPPDSQSALRNSWAV